MISREQPEKISLGCHSRSREEAHPAEKIVLSPPSGSMSCQSDDGSGVRVPVYRRRLNGRLCLGILRCFRSRSSSVRTGRSYFGAWMPFFHL
jgi:hypothetical protein